ncbi:hypothetical protein Q1W73_16770 [Asticcacaulis sp. ZE23SCel15]|uniref:hypothetical protein n=1 Tax=Asticcacaulis sp. ZE23SCel15 TaxID=3059027 RepID=UPI00265DED4A|nr:hypothetical protein [Asticcacaulis sp. ZE23SCel15]WKL57295.1 hypothetical protein Q1W73_16770 [Asticcacaulis sp. ZE23SCel15]
MPTPDYTGIFAKTVFGGTSVLKHSTLAAIAAVCIFTAPAEAQACGEPKTLSPSAIGSIKLGSSIKSLTPRFKLKTEQYASDGDDYLRHEIDVCPGVIVIAATALDRHIIDRIETTSNYFVTAKGAKVGMTVAELRKLYPRGETYTGAEEGWYASFSTKEGVYFELQIDAIPRDCFETTRNCEGVVSSVKVIKAYIQK